MSDLFTVMSVEGAARADAEADSTWASMRVTSSDYTGQDVQPDSSDEERPSAVPAASRVRWDGRLTLSEAGARLAFMSWNPGTAAKQLAAIIDGRQPHCCHPGGALDAAAEIVSVELGP